MLRMASRPARGAWIEIPTSLKVGTTKPSRPARGAWIEIVKSKNGRSYAGVAPRKGRVD